MKVEKAKIISESPYSARPWLKHYDYWVPSTINYPRCSLYEVMRTTAVEIPDATEVVAQGELVEVTLF